MSKTCIKCGTEIDDIAQFCPECGTRQTASEIICPGCGAKLESASKFCLHCGTPLLSSAYESCQRKGEFEVSRTDENDLLFNIQGVPFKMKFIKGGVMGRAELSDFFMGDTVVTQALWTAVMGNNPSKNISNLDFPVTNFSIKEVKNFLARMTKITGVEFDIPTGTQFKYVCVEPDIEINDNVLESLKKRDKHRKKCMWGDKSLHPVRSLLADQYGLYDTYDWPQLISDLAPADENYYILNPRHGDGEYYGRKSLSDDILQYEKPGKAFRSSDLYIVHHYLSDSDLSALRLVINIPLDEKLKRASKNLEKLSKESHERWAKKEIDTQLSLVKNYNTAQASYTPRVYGGNVYIDVEGDVTIMDEEITEIPINFGVISGNYIINGCSSLESIRDEDCYPFAVLGSFTCSNCPQLESGDGSPCMVFGDFICKGCSSLEDLGTVQAIGGNLDIRGTDIDEDDISPISVNGKILTGDLEEHEVNGHEYVDLGLSVMWATCNIGAARKEENGDLFVWGLTNPMEESMEVGEYMNSKVGGKYKYNGRPRGLSSSDDAAVKQWGKDWRMPTEEEFKELIEDCDWEKTSINGIAGYKVINGEDENKWIFLPGRVVRMWSSSLNRSENSKLAIILYANDNEIECTTMQRNKVTYIRPVIEID